MINQIQYLAAMAPGRNCGYMFYGPLRVRHDETGFRYFINHIETNKEYAEWYLQYVNV